jgi:hypothetical protein
MNLANIGASIMHRIRCITKGGFKINGPSTKDKGPMTSKEDKKSSNEASLPSSTQAGRIETCTELISKAMMCLENNNRQCVMRMVEEMVKAKCHDGRVIGKAIANEVRELIHRVWLESNHVERHEVMTWLMSLNVSKRWKSRAIKIKAFDKYVRKYVTEWDPVNNQIIQNTSVKVREVIAIEELLRREFKWDERVMCTKMWEFVRVNVNNFEEYGIDPCEWLNKLTANELTDTRWLGWYLSDLGIDEWFRSLNLLLSTTNAISAVHFPMVLRQIKMPSIIVRPKPRKASLTYYIAIPKAEWPWPLDKRVAIELLRKFNKMELMMALAAIADGDGTIGYYKSLQFRIAFSKDDMYEASLIRELLWQHGIKASITKAKNKNCIMLVSYKDDAVQVLSELLPYMTHPLKSLRAKLILMLIRGELNKSEFKMFYEQIKYKNKNDPKRDNALEVAIQAAPQTHTHGE